MGPYYRLLTEELVQPVPAPAEPFEVELAGCDEIYDHFQIKLALCFKDLLPGPALKDSLAKALGAFPVLSGRARRGGKGEAWVECSGQGVVVREQVAHFTKGQLRPGHTKPHLLGLCGGHFASRVNDPSSPLLTVTLSEVVYSEGLGCRAPMLGCTREAGDEEGPLGRHSSTDDDTGRDIRYVIGLSVSHSVCDGCALSVFLLQWVLGQHPSASLTPALNDRGVLLLEQYKPSPSTGAEGEEGGEEMKRQGEEGEGAEDRGWEERRLKAIYTHASSWRKAYVIGCLALSAFKSVWVTLSFTHDELEALKTHAMAPLLAHPGAGGRWVSTSNALAAHLWPILAHAWAKSSTAKRDGTLCPMAVVINSRKALGVPLNYCGNVVTMQPVTPPQPPHHQDLTQRALQVREACVVSKEGALADHTYMQRAHKQGGIAHVMHRCMRDVIQGKPGLVWDDVSTLLHHVATGRGAGGDLAFAGSAPIAMDVQMADVPGMVFVLAPPPGQNLGGKDVRVMLPSHVASALQSPQYQQRIHAYSRLHRRQGQETA